MKEIDNTIDAKALLNEFDKRDDNVLLMIDGQTLDVFLSSETLKREFFEVVKKTPSVCVCRCSPTQKAIIVRMIR